MKKIGWSFFLLVNSFLFFFALSTGKMFVNVLVIIFSLVIYKFGAPVLFESYDAKRKQNLEERKQIEEAVRTIVHSGKLFSRKNRQKMEEK